MPLSSSTVPDLLFALCAVAVVGLSLAVVLARNPVRSTLLLILSFLPVSLLYVLMRASFAGLLQVMVYAGAIMMLFTFVIMMINPAPGEGEVPGAARPAARSDLARAFLLALVGIVFIPPVRFAAALLPTPPVPREDFGGVDAISRLLFIDPANNPLTVSFELISILILVGVIAAVNFGRRPEKATRGTAAAPSDETAAFLSSSASSSSSPSSSSPDARGDA